MLQFFGFLVILFISFGGMYCLNSVVNWCLLCDLMKQFQDMLRVNSYVIRIRLLVSGSSMLVYCYKVKLSVQIVMISVLVVSVVYSGVRCGIRKIMMVLVISRIRMFMVIMQLGFDFMVLLSMLVIRLVWILILGQIFLIGVVCRLSRFGVVVLMRMILLVSVFGFICWLIMLVVEIYGQLCDSL